MDNFRGRKRSRCHAVRSWEKADIDGNSFEIGFTVIVIVSHERQYRKEDAQILSNRIKQLHTVTPRRRAERRGSSPWTIEREIFGFDALDRLS